MPLVDPDQPANPRPIPRAPLPANDPDLTPPFPGITDKLKIGDWNPPFQLTSRRFRSGTRNFGTTPNDTEGVHFDCGRGEAVRQPVRHGHIGAGGPGQWRDAGTDGRETEAGDPGRTRPRPRRGSSSKIREPVSPRPAKAAPTSAASSSASASS